MGKITALGYVFFLKGKNTRDFIKMVENMAKGLTGGPSRIIMMVNGKMENNMEKEFYITKMGLRREVNGNEEFSDRPN